MRIVEYRRHGFDRLPDALLRLSGKRGPRGERDERGGTERDLTVEAYPSRAPQGIPRDAQLSC